MNTNHASLVDFPDFEPDRVNERRMFTYSESALKTAKVVDRHCVNYPQFKTALEAMDRAFQLAGVLSTPQGVFISGDRGMGTSMAGEHFASSLPRSALFDRAFAALQISLDKHPTAASILDPLLSAVGHPFPVTTPARLLQKRAVLEDALKQRRTRMLIVHNAEFLLSQRAMSRSDRQGTTCTAALRSLMDRVQLSLVLLGNVSKGDLRKVDDALEDRINVSVHLARFAMSPAWHAFVRSFIKQCESMDLTFFSSPEEVRRLHEITGGSLRAFKHMVLETVLVAYDANAPVANADHARIAFDRAFRGMRESNPYGAA